MRRHLLIGVWLFAILLGRSGASAAGQGDPLYGRVVVGVAFDVEGQPETSPAIAALSDVRAGQPLTRREVRNTIDRLNSLGRYDDVSVEALAGPGGVSVVFKLVPRHPITRLDVRGDTGLSASAIVSVVRQRYGGVPTTTPLSAVEAVVRQHLNDEGYLGAAVRAEIELVHNPDSATLVLHLAAGPVATVGDLEVRGTSPLTVATIAQRIGARVGQPFRRRALQAALDVIESDLRMRGYYEAQTRLQPPVIVDGHVNLVVTVDSGRLVDLRVEPVGIVPGDIEALVPLRRLGSADQDLLEDSRARIEGALRAQGYWRASAPFTRVVDPVSDRLVITFRVERGPRFYVSRVDVPAGSAVPADTVRKLIGVNPGEVFDDSRFTAGLGALFDEYRRRGFYRMTAEPQYEALTEGATAERAEIVLHPNLTEGPQGRVTAITFELGAAPPVAEAQLRAVMRTRQGEPYVELDVVRDRTTLERLYQDRGFRRARVAVRPSFSADGASASLLVQVESGAEIRIGQISVVGNVGVSERAIRQELGLNVGDPAGVSALYDAQARLVAMGVFQRVSIDSLDQYTALATHLFVNLVEPPATSMAVGGGIEGGRFPRLVEGGGTDDLLEFAPRGSFEISRRNLGGANRTVSFFSRVSLKRARETSDAGAFGFTEYRASLTLRERNAWRSRTDLLVGLVSEQAVRTSFNFIRQGVNVELFRPIRPQLTFSARYSLDFTKLFDERFGEESRSPEESPALIDRAFPQVRLSVVSAGASWDRRDDILTPTRGTYSTADLEAGFRGIGSEVGFVKALIQTSAFHRLDPGARTVLAGRAEIGFASGFKRTAVIFDEAGNEVTTTVDDLPAGKRFFAGGSTTVRGFQLDRLAVPELLSADGLPLGGNALIVLNAEVRRALTKLFGRDLGGVAFADAGNVFRRANDLDLAQLRGSVGLGARYKSPLGQLGLDFGFKIRPQVVNGVRERGWEYHLSFIRGAF